MIIGKIVKSNAHHDYVCQVYQAGEVEQGPTRQDYPFGRFVRIDLDDGRWLVGLIYDTVLLNPEYGRFGPRLSGQQELTVFAPDYLREQATLLGIVASGLMNQSDTVWQGVPPMAASNDVLVRQLDEATIRQFHQVEGQLRLIYIPYLMTLNSPLVLPLIRRVMNQLMTLVPAQSLLLAVVEQQMTWRSQITPFGGTS